jgi:succinyl-CoA synthetase beta subunit
MALIVTFYLDFLEDITSTTWFTMITVRANNNIERVKEKHDKKILSQGVKNIEGQDAYIYRP